MNKFYNPDAKSKFDTEDKTRRLRVILKNLYDLFGSPIWKDVKANILEQRNKLIKSPEDNKFKN